MQKEIHLSSSDHLQLLFDYKIKKEKGTANTSQLLIELASPISAKELTDYLLSNDYFNQLVNTTLKRPLFRKERYCFENDNKLHFTEITTEKLIYSELFQNDYIGWIPVKITLIQHQHLSAILFQLNHVFIDNNGVKNLIRSFNGEKFQYHRTPKPLENSFFKRLKNGLQFSKLMLTKWQEPIANISSSHKNAIQKAYIIHDFTAEETQLIQSKIERSFHIQSMSSLLMAVYSKSINDFLTQNGKKIHKFSFQQPYDLTSKKESAYILGNRFSFIHYRLKPEQITSLSDIQYELNRQTMQQMKESTVTKSLDLQSILRFFSLPIHYWMINLPAQGKMSTFAHTYIGESKITAHFAGREIVNMTNIPPVMKNPPLTFGSVLYDGKLRIKICYDTHSIKKGEINTIYNSIKEYLLTES